MTSSISSSMSSSNFMKSLLQADPANRAGKHVSRPDIKTGYVTRSEAKSKFESTTGTSLDDAVSKVDPNGDGKVTTSELTSAAQGAAGQFDKQYHVTEQLDTNGDGKVTKNEVTGQLNTLAKQRDTNGDGKVSKDENTAAIKKLADQLDSQYASMRTNGYTRADVTRQSATITATEGNRAVLNNNFASELHDADSNGDGKISATEARDYVDKKTGISKDIKKAEKAEKSEKSNNTQKTDNTESTGNTEKTQSAAKTDKTQKTDTTDTNSTAVTHKTALLLQAYSFYYTTRSSRLSVSA